MVSYHLKTIVMLLTSIRSGLQDAVCVAIPIVVELLKYLDLTVQKEAVSLIAKLGKHGESPSKE